MSQIRPRLAQFSYYNESYRRRKFSRYISTRAFREPLPSPPRYDNDDDYNYNDESDEEISNSREEPDNQSLKETQSNSGEKAENTPGSPAGEAEKLPASSSDGRQDGKLQGKSALMKEFQPIAISCIFKQRNVSVTYPAKLTLSFADKLHGNEAGEVDVNGNVTSSWKSKWKIPKLKHKNRTSPPHSKALTAPHNNRNTINDENTSTDETVQLSG